MPRSLSISTLLLLSVIPLSSHAGEKPLDEVRSPNFEFLRTAAQMMGAALRASLNRCAPSLLWLSPKCVSRQAHRS